MAAKIVLFAFAQVLLVQSITAQCAGRYSYGNVLAADRFAADIYSTERYTADRLGAPFAAPFAPLSPCEYGPSPYAGAASYGGALATASSSPLPPSGVSIYSENAIEGPLAVAGRLPFLGTVAVEGALPTIGAGAVNYGCGNGNVGILNEGTGFGYGYEGAYGPIEAAYGAYGPMEAAYGYGPAAYGYGPFGRC